MPATVSGWLRRVERVVHAAEDTLLITLLGAMILIGASQIFMRNVLGEGLGWADESQRLLVLWIGLLGAMAASRDGRQLRIDLVSRYLRGYSRRFIEAFADLLTAVVAGTVGWYALAFVRESYAFGDELVGGIPAWLVQGVIPLAFVVIGLRHLIAGVAGLMGRRMSSVPGS
ncbi:MAG: TRAP transporter small permease subunit [Gammaproteobacteria bacterium]